MNFIKQINKPVGSFSVQKYNREDARYAGGRFEKKLLARFSRRASIGLLAEALFHYQEELRAQAEEDRKQYEQYMKDFLGCQLDDMEDDFDSRENLMSDYQAAIYESMDVDDGYDGIEYERSLDWW